MNTVAEKVVSIDLNAFSQDENVIRLFEKSFDLECVLTGITKMLNDDLASLCEFWGFESNKAYLFSSVHINKDKLEDSSILEYEIEYNLHNGNFDVIPLLIVNIGGSANMSRILDASYINLIVPDQLMDEDLVYAKFLVETPWEYSIDRRYTLAENLLTFISWMASKE